MERQKELRREQNKRYYEKYKERLKQRTKECPSDKKIEYNLRHWVKKARREGLCVDIKVNGKEL